MPGPRVRVLDDDHSSDDERDALVALLDNAPAAAPDVAPAPAAPAPPFDLDDPGKLASMTQDVLDYQRDPTRGWFGGPMANQLDWVDAYPGLSARADEIATGIDGEAVRGGKYWVTETVYYLLVRAEGKPLPTRDAVWRGHSMRLHAAEWPISAEAARWQLAEYVGGKTTDWWRRNVREDVGIHWAAPSIMVALDDLSGSFCIEHHKTPADRHAEAAFWARLYDRDAAPAAPQPRAARAAKPWPPPDGPADVYTKAHLHQHWERLKAELIEEIATNDHVTKSTLERLAAKSGPGTTLSKSKWCKLFGSIRLRVRVSLSPTNLTASLKSGRIKKRSMAQRVANVLAFNRTAAIFEGAEVRDAVHGAHKTKGKQVALRKQANAQGTMSPDDKAHGDTIRQGFDAAFKTLSIEEQQRVAALR